ncbi:hypothetical protein M8C21_022608, partial [Ambrosia artemisiifolia]
NQENIGRPLDHVHGVHVIQHSPFGLEEISQDGTFQQLNDGRLTVGVNQLLRVHTVQKNLNSKIYANSLIGVGIASSLYHSSKGRLRKYLRWADYTMIATATVCLSRALRDENPKLLMAASALCLPIQPLVVSLVHTGMMEVAFARRAVKDPDLKPVHNVHKLSALLGGAFFVADDLFPEIPYLHAGWHLAAAIGVSACNKLLE